jgi:hypothetical protein
VPTIPLKRLIPGVRADEFDLLIYWVESRTPGQPERRVDLQKFCGAGHCSCEDFKFNKSKFLLKRAMPAPNLECWHIQQARRYFSFECLNRVIEKREYEAQQNKAAAKARYLARRVPEAESEVEQPGAGTPGPAAGVGEDNDCPF